MKGNQANTSSVRVFESDFWESLTHVHPLIPLLLWVPVAFYAFWYSQTTYQLSLLENLTWMLIALLFWTLMEYGLHRFAFHFEASSKFGKRLVYLFHGLHHDDPQDATRLVMPPVPAVLIMTALWLGFRCLIPPRYLSIFMTFFIIGYLCYDYIHFATHHFPMTSRLGRFLRKWHLQHHHTTKPIQFGVSSPLWDYVFGSREKSK